MSEASHYTDWADGLTDDEVDPEAEFEQEILSMQRLIDRGVWGLEGSMGRAMMDVLTNGYCILGTSDARDYWGNHIPSRTQVQAGTKGSIEYAREMQPGFWADRDEDWASEKVSAQG